MATHPWGGAGGASGPWSAEPNPPHVVPERRWRRMEQLGLMASGLALGPSAVLWVSFRLTALHLGWGGGESVVSVPKGSANLQAVLWESEHAYF